MSRKSGSGFGSFVFGALVIGSIAFAAYSFLFGDSDSGVKGDYGFSVDSDETEDIGYTLPENRNMYYQLDDVEKGIYKEIRDAVASGETTVNIHTLNYDRSVAALYQAFDAVYYDFPEFFWLNQGWECSAYYAQSGSGYDMVVKLGCYDYWQYTTEKDEYIDAALAEAQRIASMASAQKTDYDKVKFVHDYLVVNAEYDYVCLEELNKTVQRASSQQSHTIYGCLVNKVCVCDGYAKSFQLIMSMLGIECEYVEGDAGGGHAWNYVVLDGEEYWMDITWDENELAHDNGTLLAPYGANYDYFCVTDGELYKTHTPEPTFDIPVCDSTEYNFYQYENSYLESYDFDAVCKAVSEQDGSQIIHIKFGSEAELNAAIKELVHLRKYRDIPEIGNMDVQFYSSDESCVMHIYLP